MVAPSMPVATVGRVMQKYAEELLDEEETEKEKSKSEEEVEKKNFIWGNSEIYAAEKRFSAKEN